MYVLLCQNIRGGGREKHEIRHAVCKIPCQSCMFTIPSISPKTKNLLSSQTTEHNIHHCIWRWRKWREITNPLFPWSKNLMGDKLYTSFPIDNYIYSRFHKKQSGSIGLLLLSCKIILVIRRWNLDRFSKS